MSEVSDRLAALTQSFTRADLDALDAEIAKLTRTRDIIAELLGEKPAHSKSKYAPQIPRGSRTRQILEVVSSAPNGMFVSDVAKRVNCTESYISTLLSKKLFTRLDSTETWKGRPRYRYTLSAAGCAALSPNGEAA